MTWENLPAGFLDRYFETNSALVLLEITADLKIAGCNQAFLTIMNLTQKPLGEKLADFCLPGAVLPPAQPAIGECLPARLPLQPRTAAVHLLVCHIMNTGSGYLIIGERLQLIESHIVEKISHLNQELANLTRQLQQKNRSLQEMMAELQRSEAEKEKLIQKLQDALFQVKTLRGLLPICASCKKIRNDQGYWQQIEGYIKEHSEADITHSICPECMLKLYGDYCPPEDGLPE